jgi:hypothetical protein
MFSETRYALNGDLRVAGDRDWRALSMHTTLSSARNSLASLAAR